MKEDSPSIFRLNRCIKLEINNLEWGIYTYVVENDKKEDANCLLRGDESNRIFSVNEESKVLLNLRFVRTFLSVNYNFRRSNRIRIKVYDIFEGKCVYKTKYKRIYAH